MKRAVPARVVYVTPLESDTIAERLETAWPSLSLTLADGVESAIEAVDPDVDAVVTHMDLPDGTGLDIQQRINPTDRTIPVVLLVEETTPEVAARAVQSAVAGYIPISDDFDIERIVDVVADCIDHDSRSETAAESLSLPGDQSVVTWKASLLDQLFSRLPIHLFVKDQEARHVLMSEGLVDDPEPYIGARDTEVNLVPDEEGRAGVADDFHVIETGEPIIDKEEYYPSIDRWFLTSKVPTYDADGEVTGLMGASREITERKRAEQELVRSNERLERFASVVSHDLRGPLSVASGHIELAGGDDEHLDAALQALERMEALIDELLTLAQKGVDTSEPKPVSLSTISEECWARSTDTATLVVEDSTTFLADRTRAQQLFENLFRNAIEHASEDVTVRVGVLGDETGFYVEDDGDGIPPKSVDKIFEPGFTTADDGTGFGLDIVRAVANDHGWDVRVTNTESGGARFEITGIETVS